MSTPLKHQSAIDAFYAMLREPWMSDEDYSELLSFLKQQVGDEKFNDDLEKGVQKGVPIEQQLEFLRKLNAHFSRSQKPKTMPTNPNDKHIILDKELRRDIDAIIQRLKASLFPVGQVVTEDRAKEYRSSRERSIVITKLQEAVMWLGMDLKAINDQSGGAENPYPNSKDPSNTKIDPTADGLKL